MLLCILIGTTSVSCLSSPEPKFEPEPVPDAAPEPVFPANGGFEDDLDYWSLFEGGVTRSTDASEGTHAMQMVSDKGAYATASSAEFRVQSGAKYRLTSQVKLTNGDGLYKVTIVWKDNAGMLSYANDWQGDNQPRDYRSHGGLFDVPANVTTASIVLGVEPNSTCLFDDIKLVPVLVP